MQVDSDFIRITPADRGDYRDLISPLTEAVWPEFMLHDPISDDHWDGLFEQFSEFQFALLEGKSQKVAGIANSAPLRWEGRLEDLPDEGWDWALIKSASDRQEGIEPNMLCGLQISISPDFQGSGLSKALLGLMVQLAQAKELSTVIVPVRPNIKARYPLTPIDSFLRWKTEQGLPYDPWLRVHVRSGGRIVKPCPTAMIIPGTISEWEDWTGMRFFESGDYVVPGALSPVRMDIEEDLGVYVEPNVWVVHEVR
jgi:hypothetical protein